MIKRFYSRKDLMSTIWIFIFGIFLMLTPAIASGSWDRIINFLLIVTPLLIIFWAGAKYGTYTEIDMEKKKVRGRLFFIIGGTISLSRVISLEKNGTYGGVITQISMIYLDDKNKKKEAGLTSVEGLEKQDLKDLISTIHQVNPEIKIPEELLR
jgi:hypothetical protein